MLPTSHRAKVKPTPFTEEQCKESSPLTDQQFSDNMDVSRVCWLVTWVAAVYPVIALDYPFDKELTSIANVMGENPARELFEQWTAYHLKNYTEDEKEQRFANFRNTMKMVYIHNSQHAFSYKMGINHLADLTPEEASRQLGGVRSAPQPTSLERAESMVRSMVSRLAGLFTKSASEPALMHPSADAAAAAALDWRGMLPAVKDQGKCAGAWAYSVVAAVEAVSAIVAGERAALSEQELLDCNWANDACEGGTVEDGFKWAMAHGVGSMQEYPYDQHHPQAGCKVDLDDLKRAATIDGYETLPDGEENLRKALSLSPLTVTVDAFSHEFLSYSGGVYDGPCHSSADQPGHALLAVGYGTTKEGVPYFLLRNSWSEDWGEAGYMRIKAGDNPSVGQCGVALHATRPVKDGSIQHTLNGTWPLWAKSLHASREDNLSAPRGPIRRGMLVCKSHGEYFARSHNGARQQPQRQVKSSWNFKKGACRTWKIILRTAVNDDN